MYPGNIILNLIIFTLGTFIIFLILRSFKQTPKSLNQLDLAWQVSLVLGLIFASAEVRIQTNTWQFERNNNYLKFWYDDLTKSMSDNERMNRNDFERFSENDYLKAANWYNKNISKLENQRENILVKHDSISWKKLSESIENFPNFGDSSINQFYAFIPKWTENVNDGMNKVISNKKEMVRSDFEELLFYIFPWLLALSLSLRIGKTLFLIKKNKYT